MNYLKRNYKQLILIICIILTLAASLFILLKPSKKSITLLTYDAEYFLIDNDYPSMEVLVYSSVYDTPFLDIDSVQDTYLLDVKTNDSYMLKLDSISFNGKSRYNESVYYGYLISFVVPFLTEDLISISDAYLKIEYINSESISFNIGSVYMIQDNENDELFYTTNKGYTINAYDNILLGCVNIHLKKNNECHDDINIVNIDAISTKCYVDKAKLLSTNDDISLEGYNIIRDSTTPNNSYPLELTGDEYLSLYLKYDEIYETSSLGFVIYYEVNNIIKKKIVYPFKYYKTSKPKEVIEYYYEYD